MPSITALQMVNRVRLYRRQPETTVISTPEDIVTLNAINMAIGDILSTRKWEFDLRHDQITTIARIDGLTVASRPPSSTTPASGNVFFDETVFSQPEDSALFGSFGMSILIDGSSDYGNTPIRLTSNGSATSVGGGFSVIVAFNDPHNGLLDDAACEFHYGEYMLPDTVREIVRASYAEEEMRLVQADPILRYDELFPNPGSRVGAPEVVAFGGYDIPTYESGATEPEPQQRLAIYPIPDDEYIINYSYYYRHPELTAATDELVGVPPEHVNDIVLQAASIVMMTWDQNYAADHFRDIAQQQTFQKHRAHGGSSARRNRIGSFENGSGTRYPVERGFPGKVIG